MTIADNFYNMWLDLWGNGALAAIAILAAFAYFCYKRKYGIVETFYVIFPVIVGVAMAQNVSDRYLPPWVGGIFIMGVGTLWGLALTKVFNFLEPYTKIYAIFMSMNLALVMVGYSQTTYNYLHSSEPMQFMSNQTNMTTNLTSSDLISGYDTPVSIGKVFVDFFLGAGIIGFFKVNTDIATPYLDLFMYPIAFLGLVALIPLWKILWDIMAPILTLGANVGKGALQLIVSLFRR